MAKREAAHEFTPGTIYRYLGATKLFSNLAGLQIGDLLILPIGCESVVRLATKDCRDGTVDKKRLPKSHELAQVVRDITALELLQIELTDRKLRLGVCDALNVAHDAIVRLAQHGIKARIAFEGSE